MNHVIPHCLFYHIMYQIMDDCFFLLVFIYFVYGFFFPKKGAGLHPSVFFFITESCVPSFSLLPFSLTSHNMAKSWAFLLHDSSLSPSSSKPINSHHIPSRDQKGTPAVQIPFLIQEPQCWSYSATWNWTCVLSRFWIQIPQPPPSRLVIYCVSRWAWTKRGSSLWMYCYCFHSMGGVGVEGGRGKAVY